MASLRPQIIFDLDDTLIGSFEGYSRVHRKTAEALGLPILSHEQLALYETDFVHTLRRQYAHVAGFDPMAFIAHWDGIADEHPYSSIEGVTEAIERLLSEQRELWIVTNRSRHRLAQRMREGGLRVEWFRGIFAREDQPVQKPHPSCFDPVWRLLGARPGMTALDNVVFIGDREADQRAAEAARVPFLAVRTGPEAQLGFPRGLSPDHVIDSAAEVPGWLERHDL